MDKALCVKCKGKGLCGKKNCEILLKINALGRITSKVSREFSGVSPPSVFVGRIGYPNVYIGTLAPFDEKDIDICDSPSLWFKNRMGINDIIDVRSYLINSRGMANVKGGGRFTGAMQEIALSKKPVEIEAIYSKPISPQIYFYERSAPVGPSGDIEKFNICNNIRTEKKVDSIVADTDFKAQECVNSLYRKGIDDNRITKMLSAGVLGTKAQRKLVPTRWAITAVDDIIGKSIMQKVRESAIIDSFYLYSSEYVGNHFEIIIMPYHWSFENIEATLPKSVWNQDGNAVIYSDYENYYGRKDYASNVTGAYYCARLAALEHLEMIKKQGSVLVLREVYDDYYAPLGVWVIRETVRDAFKRKPEIFQTFSEVKARLASKLKLPADMLLKESRLLTEVQKQRSLSSFSARH